jgi:hypothetical protein
MKLRYFLLLLLLPSTAWAYFDIGTGSYLFQIILASFFGLIYTVRSYITAVFRKLLNKPAAKSASSEPTEE